MKLAIFQHALFYLGEPPRLLPDAVRIVQSQVADLRNSGLMAAADYFLAGVNGSGESSRIALDTFPPNCRQVFHGLKSRSENLTLVELEKWLKATAPEEWYVLYFHAKGAVVRNAINDRWRNCMMRNLVTEWRRCVADLDTGLESVGCHWNRGLDATQNYWAGNCWWARASFLRSLPSIFERECIKKHGIEAECSRFEAEVWIGNGPRLPTRKDYHPGGLGLCQ